MAVVIRRANCAEDDLLQCPYNPSHTIIRQRMQTHLVRCRVQYPHADKVTCPFNSTHIVNKVELDLHMEMCDGRLQLDHFLTRGDNDKPIGIAPVATQCIPRDEEDWDLDVAKESAIEMVKREAESKPVLKPITTGSSKAVRKAERERRRLQYLELKQRNENAEATVSGRDPAPVALSRPTQAPPAPLPEVTKPRYPGDALHEWVSPRDPRCPWGPLLARNDVPTVNANNYNIPIGRGRGYAGVVSSHSDESSLGESDFPSLISRIGRGRTPKF